MGFFLEFETLSAVFLGTVFLLTLLYRYLTRNFEFWKKQGISGPKPKPLIGTFEPIWKKNPEDQDLESIKKYGRIFGGFEGNIPVLVSCDPELIKQITVKHFSAFTNRRGFHGFEEVESMLGALKDDEWKEMRNLLTPAFTSGKLKQMCELVEECIKQFLVHMDKVELKAKPIDFRREFSNVTIDVIARVAFGIKINSLDDPDDEFLSKVSKAFDLTPVIAYISVLFPSLFLIMRNFIENPFRYFTNIASQAVDIRLQDKDIIRKDFLQTMLGALENQTITKKKLLSQSILFLLAGHETTASTLTSMAYCLANHPDVQKKLCQEVDELMNKNKGNITQEQVSSMQYLDMVLSETLRLYPPVSRIDRECKIDAYKVDDIEFKKRSLFVISILGLHRDPEFYPNPETFDPERFTPENKANRNPFTYLPFGSGPRSCIAMRFAIMEAKLAIVHMLSKFCFEPCEKTEYRVVTSALGLMRPETLFLTLKKRH